MSKKKTHCQSTERHRFRKGKKKTGALVGRKTKNQKTNETKKLTLISQVWNPRTVTS